MIAAAPLQIDPGVVGSPTDIATLLVVLWYLRSHVEGKLEAVGAGLVALARPRDDVDDDRLQAELEVDDRDVDAISRKVVEDGREEI